MSRLLVKRLPAKWLLVPISAAVLLGAPASATANSLEAIFAPESRALAEFTATASNGYTVHVEGSAATAKLSASGPSGSATYEVPGKVTHDGISANFGKLGRVDVEFRPSHRMRIETPPNRCHGKPRVTRWGVFVGKVRFAGEHAYTSLRSGRVGGRTHTFPHWKCKRRHRGQIGETSGASDPEETLIVFEISDRRLGLEVGVLSIQPGDAPAIGLLSASLRERRGRMRIIRSALEPLRDGDFTYDESLSTATLAPPQPFSGKATFQRSHGARPSWSGSLSLALPGSDRISLVQPRFHPRLYRLGEDGIAHAAAMAVS